MLPVVKRIDAHIKEMMGVVGDCNNEVVGDCNEDCNNSYIYKS